MDFVRSYVDGDVIPAVIMWRSNLNGTVFVIDGAHRLSALIAWVHGDYGDGTISQAYWGGAISPMQRRLADETRKLINDQIGTYAYLKYIAENPNEAPNNQMLLRARACFTLAMKITWVPGTPETAEQSFFRINASASILDPTELAILKARRKPNAIATRALMNFGKGHKAWADFPEATKDEIERTAKDAYDAIFLPILQTPIKTMELPAAGQAYSSTAFRTVFDLVNLVNGIRPAMWMVKEDKGKRKQKEPQGPSGVLADDTDGFMTLTYLRAVKKAACLVAGDSGDSSGSLGLHPAVYFYGKNGRFQSSAFLATIKFVLELKHRDKFKEFTGIRDKFEEYLVRHRHFVSDLGHSAGSITRSLEPLLTMYRIVYDQLVAGAESDDQITAKLQEHPKLHALKSESEQRTATRKNFSTDDKSEAYLREAIDTPVRCKECGARLPGRSISMDHNVRQQDGGTGGADNAQLMHPYCNTGHKESRHAAAMKQAARTSPPREGSEQA